VWFREGFALVRRLRRRCCHAALHGQALSRWHADDARHCKPSGRDRLRCRKDWLPDLGRRRFTVSRLRFPGAWRFHMAWCPLQALRDLCQWGWPESCRVHPTPIYEFVVGVLIFWYLWRRGARAISRPLAPGVIVGEFLLLSGLARFLVEFIRINPRVILGMSNAQFFGLLSAIAGVIVLFFARRRFRRQDPVRRVLDHVTQHGNKETKPESHGATPECPHPERWRMFDTHDPLKWKSWNS